MSNSRGRASPSSPAPRTSPSSIGGPHHPRIFHAVDGLVRAARMDELTEDRETRGMVKHFYSEERREAAKLLTRSKGKMHKDRNADAQERFRQNNTKLQEKLREFAEARITTLENRVQASSVMKTERNAASRSGLVYRRLLTSMRSAEAKRLLQTLQEATLEKLRDDCVRESLMNGENSDALRSPEDITVAKLLRHQKALYEKRVAQGLPPPQVKAVTPSPLVTHSSSPSGSPSGRRTASPTIGAGRRDGSGTITSGTWLMKDTTDASVRNRNRALEENAVLSMPSRSWESPKGPMRGTSSLVVPSEVLPPQPRPTSQSSQRRPVSRAATPAAAEHSKRMTAEKRTIVAAVVADAKRKQKEASSRRMPSPLLAESRSGVVGPLLIQSTKGEPGGVGPSRGASPILGDSLLQLASAGAAQFAKKWLRTFRPVSSHGNHPGRRTHRHEAALQHQAQGDHGVTSPAEEEDAYGYWAGGSGGDPTSHSGLSAEDVGGQRGGRQQRGAPPAGEGHVVRHGPRVYTGGGADKADDDDDDGADRATCDPVLEHEGQRRPQTRGGSNADGLARSGQRNRGGPPPPRPSGRQPQDVERSQGAGRRHTNTDLSGSRDGDDEVSNTAATSAVSEEVLAFFFSGPGASNGNGAGAGGGADGFEVIEGGPASASGDLDPFDDDLGAGRRRGAESSTERRQHRKQIRGGRHPRSDGDGCEAQSSSSSSSSMSSSSSSSAGSRSGSPSDLAGALEGEEERRDIPRRSLGHGSRHQTRQARSTTNGAPAATASRSTLSVGPRARHARSDGGEPAAALRENGQSFETADGSSQLHSGRSGSNPADEAPSPNASSTAAPRHMVTPGVPPALRADAAATRLQRFWRDEGVHRAKARQRRRERHRRWDEHDAAEHDLFPDWLLNQLMERD